jgi:hypothetical protein
VGVLALDAALLVLDDELGLLSTGLLTGPIHGVLLPVEDPRGPLGPVLLKAQRPSGRGSTEIAGRRCGMT